MLRFMLFCKSNEICQISVTLPAKARENRFFPAKGTCGWKFVNFGMYGYKKGFAYGPTAGKPGTNNYINLLLMLFRYSP